VNEAEFWEIVESSGSPDKNTPDEQCETITEKLSGKSKEELTSFANIHRELLCKAYSWPMLKASFIILSYISDDVFEDFRSWVILNGKQRFYKTLELPDIISSYIAVDDPVEEVTGESLLYVCEEAFDGDVEELEKGYVYPEDPVINDEWPSEKQLQQEFPKLYDQFWDKENIRTLS
jgi:hypothetical protein